MIIIAVKDVFFAAKITEIADKFNKKIQFVADEKELESHMKENPVLVIVDLDVIKEGVLKRIKDLRIPLVGYTTSKVKEESICDAVITKQELDRKLPEILRKI